MEQKGAGLEGAWLSEVKTEIEKDKRVKGGSGKFGKCKVGNRKREVWLREEKTEVER